MTASERAHSLEAPVRGLYVFCLARASAAEAAQGPGLTGDTPLTVRRHEEIAAICCEVPLHEWTGAEGEAHLKDLSWLGPRALRHEEVIQQVMSVSPVLPLRFGCLFSSAGQLEEVLRSQGTRLAAFIEKAEQEEEWSLQGRVDLSVCEEAMAAADPRSARLPASTGARYLMEQKLRKDAAQAARRWLQEVEAQLAKALEGLVLDRRSLRPPTRRGQQSSLEGAFQWALLVPKGSEAELARRLEPLAEPLSSRGLQLSARGPWPLYNFVPSLVEAPTGEDAERTLG